jgi:hypothetical protein
MRFKNNKSLGSVLLLVGALLLTTIVTAQPAAALPRGAVTPGWYGSQPVVVDQCSARTYMAKGSDGKGMYFQVCVARTLANNAQAYIRFINTSRSSATARAVVRSKAIDDNRAIEGFVYTCGARTLAANSEMWCAGRNTWFDAPTPGFQWAAWGYTNAGETSVNYYGASVRVSSPAVNL